MLTNRKDDSLPELYTRLHREDDSSGLCRTTLRNIQMELLVKAGTSPAGANSYSITTVVSYEDSTELDDSDIEQIQERISDIATRSTTNVCLQSSCSWSRVEREISFAHAFGQSQLDDRRLEETIEQLERQFRSVQRALSDAEDDIVVQEDLQRIVDDTERKDEIQSTVDMAIEKLSDYESRKQRLREQFNEITKSVEYMQS